MPLLGKLSAGALQQLLEASSELGSNAVLHVHSPEQEGTLSIEGGQVVHVTHNHHAVSSAVDALLQAPEGHFLFCRAGEPPSSMVPNIWLLDPDADRRESLQIILDEVGVVVAVLMEPSQVTALSQELAPRVFLVDVDLALEMGQSLLSAFKPNARKPAPQLVLLGEPRSLPSAFDVLAPQWMPWPTNAAEVGSILEPWTQSVAATLDAGGALALESEFLKFLTSIGARLPAELRLHVHPARRAEIGADSPWRDWLLSLHSRAPLSEFLLQCPGTPEQAQIVVSQLLQSGVLVSTDTLDHEPHPVDELDDDELLAEAVEAPPPLQLHKVIVMGLRGKWKADWVNALKKISQNQAARIPREHPFPVPYLPKMEHARVPLRADTLLVVYGARNEEIIDQIMEQTNQHITGMLYFGELDNPEELEYIRFMRQTLAARFDTRHLYMVAAPKGTTQAQARKALKMEGNDLVVILQKFDLHSTHTALQTLLQSFAG